MSSDTVILEQQNAQREVAKRATFGNLQSKKPRRLEFETELDPEQGTVSFLFIAIPRVDYDELVGEHQPTPEQLAKESTAQVNPDTFPPALLSAVCREPKLSAEQWAQIFTSDNYSAGELTALYWQAQGLCNRSLDLIPFG